LLSLFSVGNLLLLALVKLMTVRTSVIAFLSGGRFMGVV
jgi:hypothetical protein